MIGAEQVAGLPRAEQDVLKASGERLVMGGEQRGEDRRDHHNAEVDRSRHRHLVAQQSRPETTPGGTRGRFFGHRRRARKIAWVDGAAKSSHCVAHSGLTFGFNQA